MGAKAAASRRSANGCVACDEDFVRRALEEKFSGGKCDGEMDEEGKDEKKRDRWDCWSELSTAQSSSISSNSRRKEWGSSTDDAYCSNNIIVVIVVVAVVVAGVIVILVVVILVILIILIVVLVVVVA